MFASSVGLYFGFIPSQWLGWHPAYLLRFPPQVWRLATGFLITGPQLGLLMDTYFFYKAASDMETGHPRMRRKEDFIWYLICVCSFIAVSILPRFARSLSFCHFPPSRREHYGALGATPQHICPDSAVPLQLSRFLELREITPVLPAGPIIRKIRTGGRYRHGGMSIWMARVTLICSSGFLAPYIFFTFAFLVS